MRIADGLPVGRRAKHKRSLPSPVIPHQTGKVVVLTNQSAEGNVFDANDFQFSASAPSRFLRRRIGFGVLFDNIPFGRHKEHAVFVFGDIQISDGQPETAFPGDPSEPLHPFLPVVVCEIEAQLSGCKKHGALTGGLPCRFGKQFFKSFGAVRVNFRRAVIKHPARRSRAKMPARFLQIESASWTVKVPSALVPRCHGGFSSAREICLGFSGK